MFLAAFFILFSFFNLAGVAGRAFMKFSDFLVGEAVFLFPLIFVLGGLSFFSSKEKGRWSIVSAAVLLCLGVCGILGAFDLSRIGDLGFQFFYLGRGGCLGNLVAWPLLRIFGFWLSQIVFLSMLIIAGLIFWHFLYFPRKRKEASRLSELLTEGKEGLARRPFIRKIFAPKFQVEKIEQKEILPQAKKGKTEETGLKVSAAFEPKIKPLEPSAVGPGWNLPSLDLLAQDKGIPQAGDVKTNAEIIEKTLHNFGISVKMSEINIGPTVTQYTLRPAEGVKLSKITALNNNLALALAAHPLRIEAPIPGKSLVGVEVPNKTRTLVRLRNLFSEPDFQDSASTLSFAIGRDVVGRPFCADLARMPHLLVAGSTGSGKTICLSSIILSLLYRNSPKHLRFILIDPKRVEFTNYNGLPNLLAPVIYDVQKTLSVLKWLIEEMERRFEALSRVGVRNIDEYNSKLRSSSEDKIMPYIILIIDELADLMTAKGREIEAGIVKLAQKSRAVGIHLILATQRPSVEVITGLIKVNITSRIAFQVASQVDSRTILDTAGAEKLLGLGDLLFISAEISKPKRIQGAYVSGKEVQRVVDFVIKQNHAPKEGEDELAESISAELERVEKLGTSTLGVVAELDPVYQEAKRLVLETRKASASFLQRKLRIGYARAARLLDMLEERGIVGPADGAKPREVFGDIEALTREQREEEEEKTEEIDE
jgi:S-DNA-T family DNA segregation ATPase FtsK/SpoIIIE